MNLILASSSPRRKELLTKSGYQYKIEVSDIDETLKPALNPEENVARLGYLKALAIAKKYPNDAILGCDTIVVLENEIYGKPKDDKMAFAMLKNLAGKTHKVISGVGIISPKQKYNFTVMSSVTFKPLTDEEIISYIETKECFGKAGGYAIQGLGKQLIASYEGELENIIGLPIKEIKMILGDDLCNLK